MRTTGGLTGYAEVSSALCMKIYDWIMAGGLRGSAVISSALCMIIL